MKFQSLVFITDEFGNKVSEKHFENGLTGRVVVIDKGNRDRDSDKEWRVECYDSRLGRTIPLFFEDRDVDDVTTDKNEVIELLTIIEKEENDDYDTL